MAEAEQKSDVKPDVKPEPPAPPVEELVKAAVEKALKDAAVSHEAVLAEERKKAADVSKQLSDHQAAVAREKLLNSIVAEYGISELAEFLDGKDEAEMRSKAKKLSDKMKARSPGAPAPVTGPRTEPAKDLDWAAKVNARRRSYQM